MTRQCMFNMIQLMGQFKSLTRNLQKVAEWFDSNKLTLNHSYLGVGYITQTKHVTPNFTSLVSLTQVSV